MNLDDLKTTWQCQDKIDLVKLDPDELLAHLKQKRRAHNRMLLGRDIFVAACLAAFAVFLFLQLWGQEIVWPLYLGVALLLGSAAYMPWHTRQSKKKEKRFSNSLRDELRKRSWQLHHQIRFTLWGQIWVYILPIVTALCLFFWQNYINGHSRIDRVLEGTLFNILIGLTVYAISWFATRPQIREKRKVDRELEALGYPVQETKSPILQQVAQVALVVGALAACGYLLVLLLNQPPLPGAPIQPDRPEVYAKVAPFTGVRWEPDSDQPTVRVRGEWLRLTAVDGIPIEHLMQTARERFGNKARKRFAEDLVELLSAADHNPEWTVTLMLDRGDGKGPAPFEEKMTHKKREAAKAYR